MSFNSLGLSNSLLKKLALLNYTTPYPIQKEAIPVVLAKKDVLGIAKTGSGKTASYVLPILNNLEHTTLTKDRNVNVLVLVPTRELAEQVKDVFYDFSYGLKENIKTMAVYGGVSINPQMKGLFGVNILVATPGRLLELIENKALQLSKVETLVLDEADKMLNLGFEEEMSKIFGLLPVKRQNLLFSATLTDDINNINEMLLNNPVVIKIKEEETNIEAIKQTAYYVSEEKKGPLLRHLIEEKKLQQVLVFVSSTVKADKVTSKLVKNGINAAAIHSKKSQGSRNESLRRFKTGEINVLVATDLLGRGIDIMELPCVINYELPRSPKDFIHRIGRTGRADFSGEAITLVTPNDEQHFKVIQKKMNKWVDRIDAENIDF